MPLPYRHLSFEASRTLSVGQSYTIRVRAASPPVFHCAATYA